MPSLENAIIKGVSHNIIIDIYIVYLAYNFSIINARVGEPLCRSKNGAGLRISACIPQKS